MRLTATTIRTLTLPPNKSDHIFFDADLPGFGLRLRATGGRNWVVQYAIAGRTRRMALGSTAAVDPGRAREAAKDILARVRLGGDPANEKHHARARAEETFGALLKPFLLRQQSRLKPHSLQQAEYGLTKLCRDLHALPITALDRRTIAARLTAIATTNGPATANRTRSTLSAFCTWCAKEGYLDANPTSFTNKAIENGPRDRLLSDAELATIWSALRDHEFGVVVKLLALTGLRASEIGDLCWSEIDFTADLITLPASRTKNGKIHLVPMSPPVRALIEAQPHQEERDFLFGRAAGKGFTSWSTKSELLDPQITEINGAPMAPWVLHDLRRKFSTDLHERLNVSPHIVETLLGHVGHKGGVAGTYNRAAYLDECARALSRWGDHVTALVTGKKVAAKVVPLRA
jgi:integrase